MRNRASQKKGTFLIGIGLLLFAAALLLTGYNLFDEMRASSAVHDIIGELETSESTERIRKTESAHMSDQVGANHNPGEMEIPDYILNPQMDMPQTKVDSYEYIGILEIPSYGLKLPVISEWSYPALRVSPCRYHGSPYTDNFVISAHNYRSHFGCLKDMQMGEEVRFTDLDGNQFVYEVMELTILNPEDAEDMVNSEWDLTMFTCTIGGQYRVTVRCGRNQK